MAVLGTFTMDPGARLDFSVRWGAPDWQASTAYAKRDVVRDPADGCYYEAKVTHTSGASNRAADSAKWDLVEDLWLASGESLSTSTWTITPPGELAEAASSISADGQVANVWLESGVAGKTYTIVNKVETDSSPVARKDERTFKVKVKDR
ncbi:MAG: hypothetical protein R3253_05745 [Longimicrobiales bacterium]|nr:hypothetical protein [Longimicrobiales bacterium]